MKKLNFIFIAFHILFGCNKGAEDPVKLGAPGKAVLVFPGKDAVCTVGTLTSIGKNAISFSWNSTENTESYELNLKNLITGELISKSTAQTTIEVDLEKNTPYSWFIVSRNKQTSINSEIWKFYSSGPGVISYAPFPANLLSPVKGSTISFGSGKISLDWNGTDVEGDINSYDIYLGVTTTPGLLAANVKESILHNVSVNPNTMYYWKIVAKDSQGNSSVSATHNFQIE